MRMLLLYGVFLLYGLAQLVAGYSGIEHHFGWGWAIAALFLALGLRFTLPVTIGAFFGATDVWDWHWALAVLFVAPGIAFVAPVMLISMVNAAKSRLS